MGTRTAAHGGSRADAVNVPDLLSMMIRIYDLGLDLCRTPPAAIAAYFLEFFTVDYV